MTVAPAPAAAVEPAPIDQAGELRSARIESLRAVAALGVLVGHAFIIALAYRGTSTGLRNQLISGGLLTVFLFFTLSGYLLYWPFARRDFGGGGRIDLTRYARNRALRILPLYYAVVAVLLALDPLGAHRADWWRYALFIEDYSARTVERLDSPMWSLGVEMQFYILLPLIAAGIARLARGSLARAMAIVVALGAASFALRLERVLIGPSPVLSPLDGPFALPTLLYFFCTGMLVALLRQAVRDREGERLPRALEWSDPWLLAAVGLWALAAAHPSWEPLIAAASFLAVGTCVLAPRRGVLLRILDWRGLAAVGVASYSLYLWHVPLLLALSGTEIRFSDTRPPVDLTAPQSFAGLLALALPVCLAAALLSYRLIEAPFLRLRRGWVGPRSSSRYRER